MPISCLPTHFLYELVPVCFCCDPAPSLVLHNPPGLLDLVLLGQQLLLLLAQQLAHILPAKERDVGHLPSISTFLLLPGDLRLSPSLHPHLGVFNEFEELLLCLSVLERCRVSLQLVECGHKRKAGGGVTDSPPRGRLGGLASLEARGSATGHLKDDKRKC